MKLNWLLLFLGVGLIGCSSPETKPATPTPPKIWARGENPPSRWLLVHLTVAPERIVTLNEVWRNAGIVFTNAALGFVENSEAKNLNVILTGRTPSEGSERATSPLAQKNIRFRIMTDNPSYTFLKQLKAAGAQGSQGVISTDVVGTLKTTLEEDWSFCLFSFDSRIISSNLNWEKEFFDVLAAEPISHNTGIIMLTEYPAQENLIESFSAKPSNLTTRARLSSKLKQSKKYELIFSRQETGARAHYISTHGLSTTRPEAFAEAPEILVALEATYSTKGPDLLAIRSREAMLNYLRAPIWFWTPQLKEQSNRSQAKIYWTDVIPFIAASLAKETSAENAGEMFTAWLLRR